MNEASTAARPERLEILEAGGRDLVGLWQNVLVIALRDLPTAAMLERLGAIQQDIAGRFPEGFAALAILPVLRPRPMPPGMLDAARALTETAPPELQAVAEVIDGKGFMAATARSMATGILMLGRPRYAMKIFPGVEPAAAWLAAWVERAERPTAPRRLAEAIRHTLI
jgi:hypothetical protein